MYNRAGSEALVGPGQGVTLLYSLIAVKKFVLKQRKEFENIGYT
jgi:hypothetical protein